MKIFTNALFYQILFFCIMIIIFIILFNALRNRTKNPSEEHPYAPYLPYGLKKYIFNKSESIFFAALLKALQNQIYVAPKIGLKDFLYIRKNTRNYMAFFHRISQKHVDFLLFIPNENTPLCAIEIDGPTHQYDYETIDRDILVEQIYYEVGLPLLRFPAKTSYTTLEITEALKPFIDL